MIMSLSGCLEEEAQHAWDMHKNVIDAVDSILVKPVTQCDKYIPAKPVVSNGMDEEQQERCERGRDLQARVNAVFSVAHSQVKNLQSPEADEEQTMQLPTVTDSQILEMQTE